MPTSCDNPSTIQASARKLIPHMYMQTYAWWCKWNLFKLPIKVCLSYRFWATRVETYSRRIHFPKEDPWWFCCEIPLSNKKPQQKPPVRKKIPPKPTKLEDKGVLENLADLLTQRQRKDSLPRLEPEVFSGDYLCFQLYSPVHILYYANQNDKNTNKYRPCKL
jgi:hypothetical protein